MITVREAATDHRARITHHLHASALRKRKSGNEWWTTRDWALQYRHTHPPPTRPRATEQRHHSPTGAALSHRAPSRPPVMGIIGALYSAWGGRNGGYAAAVRSQ